MDTSRKKPSPPKDFTHYEACGCRVTFIAASGYKTSRMLPGKDCIEHTHVDQAQARTDLVERGRDAMITATATQAARDAYEKGGCP